MAALCPEPDSMSNRTFVPDHFAVAFAMVRKLYAGA